MKTSLLLVSASAVLAAPTALETRTTPISADDWNELHRAAQLSSAAYSACQNTAFGVQITKQLDNGATDTQGYIGHDDTLKRITVALRGSTTPKDFWNDLDIQLVPISLAGVTPPADVQVVKGVHDAWASIHDEVIAEVRSLRAQFPEHTIEAAGHSLGGALTYLAHVALQQNFPDARVASNALAAFALGNDAWAAWAATLGSLRRGNNKGDGVPNMYQQYRHYGTEFYGASQQDEVRCEGERDQACSAGDGWVTVDVQHLSNSGVTMLTAGCG